VTGASGFLGTHLVQALRAAGATVVAAVRDPAKARHLGEVACVRADLTETDSLEAAFRDVDAVVSNAALGSNQGDMADFERVNQQGVSNLMEAAHRAGVKRVVHISTVAVYRTRLWSAMDEDTPRYDTDRRRLNWSDLTTDWRYARTKTLAEAVAWERARAHDLALTTLRPGPIYGSRDPKATARIIHRLTHTRVVPAPTVGVPWVHVGDVAVSAVTALARPETSGRAYNLAGPPVSQLTFLRAMKRALARPGLAWLLPIPVPFSVRYDTTAAARDLAFVSRPLEVGLAEAVSGT
jgi:nucleoside-diphosphate-sugar epimerase